MKKITAIALFLCVFFVGCGDEREEDYSIGEITITDIPVAITVASDPEKTNDTFKVYLNASNSMDETQPPVAKGLVKVTEAMKQADETYKVTIQLQNPNYKGNPNDDTGPWRGTADYFSIMLCPQTAMSVGYIWAKAGYTFNKGKAICSWKGLIDLRGSSPLVAGRADAMFNLVVKADPDIKTQL